MISKSIGTLSVVAGFCLLFSSMNQFLSAATVTLSANRDNSIFQTTYNNDTPPQGLNSVNFGAEPYTQTGTAGADDTSGKARHLVSFDHSTLPAFTQINSVTLRMYHRIIPGATNLTDVTPFTVEVHAISTANADWAEGTGLLSNSATWDSGSNWNFKDESTAALWAGGTGVTNGGLTSAGVDYEVTALASQSFNAVPADNAAIDFVFTGSSAELTNLIAGWDTTNPGFLLFHSSSTLPFANRRLFYHTREVADLALRPQLIVDFTAPIPAPEPSSIVLLGLGVLGLARRRR